jgi:dTDP-4-amino-4,6-dideoxygalactose transaminase
MKIPLAKPNPARLSESISRLRQMEDRAIFSNFGPLSVSFEKNLVSQMFGGLGACLTVCNATVALMLAIREALDSRPPSRRRYALMPSFTFAAAAQAAKWNRLTPLFCDIDRSTFCACETEERRMLERYGHDIAVVVPYAAFGYDIDLSRYERIQQHYDIPVVVDAAASLGTISSNGLGFGAGFSGAVVYSMHVTKSFATSEGGLIHSGNSRRIETLRCMSNFGFGEPRSATLMGLNGKMSEVAALLADLRLESFEAVMKRRTELVALYRRLLPNLSWQHQVPTRQAHQFASFLLPAELAQHRETIRSEMSRTGVASGTYFSPHVAQQEYFQANSKCGPLPVTDNVASRILSLPLFDTMSDDEVVEVADAVNSALSIVTESVAFTGNFASLDFREVERAGVA